MRKEIEYNNSLKYFYENMKTLDLSKEDEFYEYHQLDHCVWESGLLNNFLWRDYIIAREELGLEHLYIPKLPSTIYEFIKLIKTLMSNDVDKFYVSATLNEERALGEFCYIPMGKVLIKGKLATEMWAIPTYHYDVKISKEQYDIYSQDPFDKTTTRYKLEHRKPIEISGEPMKESERLNSKEKIEKRKDGFDTYIKQRSEKNEDNRC